jgi:hypothetical protein
MLVKSLFNRFNDKREDVLNKISNFDVYSKNIKYPNKYFQILLDPKIKTHSKVTILEYINHVILMNLSRKLSKLLNK